MLIGQLSKASGFTRDTIRYYEKIGLIVLDKKTRMDNNYKDYPDEVLHRLLVIKKYKDLGFTLEEIRELLVLQSIQLLDLSKVIKVMELKIKGTDERIEELHSMRLKQSRELQLLRNKKTGRIIQLPEMKIAA